MMQKGVSLSWLLVVTVAGCSFISYLPAPHGPVPPGMSRDEYKALEFIGARALNCPQEKVTYEQFGKGRHLFKGCDDVVEMIQLHGADADAYTYGNEELVTMPSPSNRFAKEAKCSLRTTSEERVNYRTRIVDGCGKQTTYVYVCNPQCTWVANVDATSKREQP
jgi:hypothetical protein